MTKQERIDFYSDMTEAQRTELLMHRLPAGTTAGFGIEELEAKVFGEQIRGMNS